MYIDNILTLNEGDHAFVNFVCLNIDTWICSLKPPIVC